MKMLVVLEIEAEDENILSQIKLDCEKVASISAGMCTAFGTQTEDFDRLRISAIEMLYDQIAGPGSTGMN